jgi:hypothetical protein
MYRQPKQLNILGTGTALQTRNRQQSARLPHYAGDPDNKLSYTMIYLFMFKINSHVGTESCPSSAVHVK